MVVVEVSALELLQPLDLLKTPPYAAETEGNTDRENDSK
jgi:hypothetical protein